MGAFEEVAATESASVTVEATGASSYTCTYDFDIPFTGDGPDAGTDRKVYDLFREFQEALHTELGAVEVSMRGPNGLRPMENFA
jgi:hypothetical protein